jgi:hypothetical protein
MDVREIGLDIVDSTDLLRTGSSCRLLRAEINLRVIFLRRVLLSRVFYIIQDNVII